MAVSTIKIDRPNTVYQTTEYYTESNTLTYTGQNFTIPANTIYGYCVFIGYQNHAPLELLLCRSDVDNSPYRVLAHATDGAYAFMSGYTQEDLTVYIWGKYTAGGSNARAYIRGWYKYV